MIAPRRTYGGVLKLSKGYSQWGADMGRHEETPPIREEHQTIKLHLRRVRIDSGGYDAGGAYWGSSWPLYQVSGEINNGEDLVEYYLRAVTRDEAKQLVRRQYPGARFYR